VTVTNKHGDVISQTNKANLVADLDSTQSKQEQQQQTNEMKKKQVLATPVPPPAAGLTYLTFAQAEHDISVLLRPLIAAILCPMNDSQKKNIIRCLSKLTDKYNAEASMRRNEVQSAISRKNKTNRLPSEHAAASPAFLPSIYSYLPLCWGTALNTDTNRHTNLNDVKSMESIGKEAFLDLSQVCFLLCFFARVISCSSALYCTVWWIVL
jgi:hypothetical protein